MACIRLQVRPVNAVKYILAPYVIERTERRTTRNANMATDDAVIAKIFGKIDTDNNGSICEAELSAAFVGFDRDGELHVRMCY